MNIQKLDRDRSELESMMSIPRYAVLVLAATCALNRAHRHVCVRLLHQEHERGPRSTMKGT